MCACGHDNGRVRTSCVCGACRSVASKLMTVMGDVLSAMWPVRYFFNCMVGLEWLLSSMCSLAV